MGMAKITHSELAPSGETVIYTLANEQFKLTPKGTYETDDQIVIANALDNPWLQVEFDAPEPQPEVEEAEEDTGTAIEAGTDQDLVEFEGDIAATLAADEQQDDEESKS